MAKGRGKKAAPFFQRKALDPAAQQDRLADILSRVTLSEPVPVERFEDMKLKADLLRGIHAYGLVKPAFCQQRIIVPSVVGLDVICQAQSGMGKTAAFCIAILQRINLTNRSCQALVLAPTRELAEQISGVFMALGKYMGVKVSRCIGGTKTRANRAEVLVSHIAVGTLGRVANLLKLNFIVGDSISMFVIDEADKMIMDPSYRNDMRDIIGSVSATAQVIVMSATMPSYALERTEAFMDRPLKVLVKSDQLTLDGIQQFYVNVGTEEQKLPIFDELYPFLNKFSGIAFCNMRSRAEWLNRQMQARGHKISDMVGTMEQPVRTQTLKSFRSGQTPVLIASDLLGRGIDIHHVKLVINYDLPLQKEDYIHRVGRAGRYGKKGIAITFITDSEMERFKGIEAFYNTSIIEMPPNISRLFD